MFCMPSSDIEGADITVTDAVPARCEAATGAALMARRPSTEHSVGGRRRHRHGRVRRGHAAHHRPYRGLLWMFAVRSVRTGLATVLQ